MRKYLTVTVREGVRTRLNKQHGSIAAAGRQFVM